MQRLRDPDTCCIVNITQASSVHVSVLKLTSVILLYSLYLNLFICSSEAGNNSAEYVPCINKQTVRIVSCWTMCLVGQDSTVQYKYNVILMVPDPLHSKPQHQNNISTEGTYLYGFTSTKAKHLMYYL